MSNKWIAPVVFGALCLGATESFAQVQPAGGVIDIGQAFNVALAPYINAAVQSLIVAGLGWLFYLLRTKLNISIDAEHRAALTQFAQRQGASLVADGKVALQGKTITVDNAALATAANEAVTMIPDVLKHFGITPGAVAERIKDAIPQVPAAAPVVAQSITTKVA